jgi:hypothetical protein
VEDEIDYDILNPEEEEKQEGDRSSRDRKSTGSGSSSFVITKCDSTPESAKVKKSVDSIFKERLNKLKMEQMKDMVLSDQLDYRDPQNFSEFAQEIYQNMMAEEARHMVDPNYL